MNPILGTARGWTRDGTVRFLGRLLAAAALVLPLSACDAWSESDPDIVDIATPSAPEFALVFQPTGVTLRAEVDGSIPDPRPPVSMGPDGRLVVPTSNQGVAIWSDDGRHLENVGRRGEGPGEFGASPLPVFDGTGNLHVFDPTQGAWHRFDESASLISSVRSEHLAQVALPGQVAVLGPDSVLTSAPSPLSNPRRQFRVLTADGESTGFGAVLEGGATGHQARPIALTDRGTFWAGPPQGSDEYVIEEWSLDGTLLRSIRREPPWGELDRTPGPNPMPRFPMLATGPDGEIIIMAVVSVPEDPVSGGTIEVWYEVLDLDRLAVLASEQVLVEGMQQQPPTFGMAPHSRLGFRLTTVEFGLPVVEMLEYELVPDS